VRRRDDSSYTKRREHPHVPVIDIHIRISRKLLLWVVAIAVGWVVLVGVLTGAWFGHSSSGFKVGPVQTVQAP
jgi:hypothetical protein